MSQLLQDCCADGTLRTQARAHQRDFAKHEDFCIVEGIQANDLMLELRSLQLPQGIAAGEEREAAVLRQNEAIVYATIEKYYASHALSKNEELVMATVLKDLAAQEEREVAVLRQNEAIVYAMIEKYYAGHALSKNETVSYTHLTLPTTPYV